MASKRESESSSRSSTSTGVRIGRVGRPHGNGGAFTVGEPSRRQELMGPGQLVELAGRERRIAWRGGTEQRPLLKLDGTDDRAGAASLAGEAIVVDRAELGALEAGEHLVDDLIGCALVDGDRRVGLVSGVLNLPSVDCLEVDREGAEGSDPGPLLVPMVADAVRAIDVAARRIEVDLEFLEGAGRGQGG